MKYRKAIPILALSLLAIQGASSPTALHRVGLCGQGPAHRCQPPVLCAKINERGEEQCYLPSPPFETVVGFPYEFGHPAVCTQPPRKPGGTHLHRNTLYAVDYSTVHGRRPGRILAGVTGTAYVYDRCRPGPDARGSHRRVKYRRGMNRGKKTASIPVTSPSCGWGFGNYVQIVTREGYAVLYAHLDRVFVRNGSKVFLGQPIGTEGMTGYAGHRHLHLQVNYLGLFPTAEQLKRPAWSTDAVPFRIRVPEADAAPVWLEELSCP